MLAAMKHLINAECIKNASVWYSLGEAESVEEHNKGNKCDAGRERYHKPTQLMETRHSHLG